MKNTIHSQHIFSPNSYGFWLGKKTEGSRHYCNVTRTIPSFSSLVFSFVFFIFFLPFFLPHFVPLYLVTYFLLLFIVSSFLFFALPLCVFATIMFHSKLFFLSVFSKLCPTKMLLTFFSSCNRVSSRCCCCVCYFHGIYK
jgi:hypothetical protein